MYSCASDVNAPSISKPIDSPESQTYWLNDAAYSVTYSAFTLDITPVTACTTDDLTFNVSVVSKSTNQVIDEPKFLTFDSNAKTLTWVSSDSSDVDDYTITVTAHIQQSQQSATSSFEFDLNLREQFTCNLEAPELESKTFDLSDGASSFSSTLGEFICTNSCEEGQVIEYEFSIAPFSSFFATNERRMDWSAATVSDIDVYTVTVIAKVDS